MPMLHQDQRSRPEESNFLSEDKHRFCRAGKHSCEKGGYEPIPNLNGPAHLKKQQQQQHQQQQQQYLEEQQQQQQHQENSKEEEEDKLISRALGQVTVGVVRIPHFINTISFRPYMNAFGELNSLNKHNCQLFHWRIKIWPSLIPLK